MSSWKCKRQSKKPRDSDLLDKGFNLLFFSRIFSIQKYLFTTWLSFPTLLFVTLLLTELAEQYVGYQVGHITGDYYLVLAQKDLEGFWNTTYKSFVILVGISFIKTMRFYIARQIAAELRYNLTRSLQSIYFSKIGFYKLNILNLGQLDNADQRITADVDVFCDNFAATVVPLLLTPVTISYYTYDAIDRAGWQGPLGMFIFFLAGSVFNKFLMGPVVRANAEKDKREGDLRYKHVSLRVASESFAFSGDTRTESTLVNRRLSTLIRVQRKLYNKEFILNLSTNTFAYLGSIASFIVIAIPIFEGKYDDLTEAELGDVISVNSFVCFNLISQFTKLVQISGIVSALAGATHRIVEMLEVLETHSNSFQASNFLGPEAISNAEPHSDDSSESLLSVTNVTVCRPSSMEPLIKDFNLEVTRGEHVLIMGRSSSGKTSLLRTLRGLWSPQYGSISPGPGATEGFMFLPQTPFLTEGSLLDQITYPERVLPADVDDTVIRELTGYIYDLGLDGLLVRCENSFEYVPTWEWNHQLSPGEAQRIILLRLFYHRPSVAFLDEATSAISSDLEELALKKCSDLGITMVSVGHRETLRKYHKWLLKMGLEDGCWSLSKLEQ